MLFCMLRQVASELLLAGALLLAAAAPALIWDVVRLTLHPHAFQRIDDSSPSSRSLHGSGRLKQELDSFHLPADVFADRP
jgi:hypothetical protein